MFVFSIGKSIWFQMTCEVSGGEDIDFCMGNHEESGHVSHISCVLARSQVDFLMIDQLKAKLSGFIRILG